MVASRGGLFSTRLNSARQPLIRDSVLEVGDDSGSSRRVLDDVQDCVAFLPSRAPSKHARYHRSIDTNEVKSRPRDLRGWLRKANLRRRDCTACISEKINCFVGFIEMRPV